MSNQGTNAENIFHGKGESQASKLFYTESTPFISEIIKNNLEPGRYTLVDLGGHKGELLRELLLRLPDYNFEASIIDEEEGLDADLNVKKIVADITNTPLVDKSVDVAVMRYVLPWNAFEKQKLIFKEIARICKGICIIQHQGANSNNPRPLQDASKRLFSGIVPKLKRDNGFFTESSQIELWMDELNIHHEKLQERKIETLSEMFIEKFNLSSDDTALTRETLKGCDYIMQTTWILRF
ncbi:MAG: methyltransferase domain-containing protein [Candidatus Taylorbacteria bacterium]